MSAKVDAMKEIADKELREKEEKRQLGGQVGSRVPRVPRAHHVATQCNTMLQPSATRCRRGTLLCNGRRGPRWKSTQNTLEYPECGHV